MGDKSKKSSHLAVHHKVTMIGVGPQRRRLHYSPWMMHPNFETILMSLLLLFSRQVEVIVESRSILIIHRKNLAARFPQASPRRFPPRQGSLLFIDRSTSISSRLLPRDLLDGMYILREVLPSCWLEALLAATLPRL